MNRRPQEVEWGVRSVEEPGDGVIIIYVHTRTLDADALPKKSVIQWRKYLRIKVKPSDMEQAKVSSSFSQSAQSADEDAAAAADHRVVQLVEPSPSLSRCHNRRQMFAQKQRRRKKNSSSRQFGKEETTDSPMATYAVAVRCCHRDCLSDPVDKPQYNISIILINNCLNEWECIEIFCFLYLLFFCIFRWFYTF